MKLKKLLLIMAIVIGALMIANVSKAAVIDNDFFTMDVKNYEAEFVTDDDNYYESVLYERQGEDYLVELYIQFDKTQGGGAWSEEDMNDYTDGWTGSEITEKTITKMSGVSTMVIKFKDTENSVYGVIYAFGTDNYTMFLYCYSKELFRLNSQSFNEIINSVKIKDTIALQNDGVPFSDVSNKQWYHAPIKYVYEKGYISGLNAYTYGPNVNLSRCMLVTILWRISGNPAAKGNVSFPDIKTTDWYYTPVIWAAENGIVNGYGNGKFGPNDNISREQLATMLRNYSIFRGKDSSYTANSISSFQDNKKVADWAVPGVAWAVKNSIIGGKNSGTIIDPQGNATRAEVATMIMKLDTNVLK